MRILLTLLCLYCASTTYAQTSISEQLQACKIDSIDGQKVWTVVEEPPVYEGGLSQLYKAIVQKIKLKRKELGVSSRIYIYFVVDAKGKVRNLCLTKDWEATEELLASIDHWTAGKKDGENVPVSMIFPIMVCFR